MSTHRPLTGWRVDPFKALVDTMAFSSNDWGSARDFAWLYGIVCGWADEDDDSHSDIAAKFGWSNEQVARLRKLHEEFKAAAASYEATA